MAESAWASRTSAPSEPSCPHLCPFVFCLSPANGTHQPHLSSPPQGPMGLSPASLTSCDWPPPVSHSSNTPGSVLPPSLCPGSSHHLECPSSRFSFTCMAASGPQSPTLLAKAATTPPPQALSHHMFTSCHSNLHCLQLPRMSISWFAVCHPHWAMHTPKAGGTSVPPTAIPHLQKCLAYSRHSIDVCCIK